MRPSIRRRLLTLSVASTLLVVAAAGTLVWTLTRRSLYRALDRALHTEALALASRLEMNEGRIEFEQHLGGLFPAIPGKQGLAWIVGEDGQVVFSSPELEGRPAPLEGVEWPKEVGSVRWLNADLTSLSRTCRVVVLHAALGARGDSPPTGSAELEPHASVFVARSLEPMDETLTRLAAVLAFVLLLAGLASLLLGWILARSGTAPISAVARALERVDPGRPGLTLERSSVPVELDPLVGTVGRLLERIRGAMERQRQLTADVAHDLRTPLAGVRTLLDVCLARPRESREYVEAIEKAGHALRQLSGLVDDALSMARLDAGIDEPVLEVVSVRDVLAPAIALVQPFASARDVVIACEDACSGSLRSDRAMLAKALSNLLANAVEHSPPGETVRVGVALSDGVLEIAVEDRGSGIPSELQARVFERFVRGDAARRGDEHHGLGLPIARGLARLLGGDVRLDSSSPAGSRFVLTASAV